MTQENLYNSFLKYSFEVSIYGGNGSLTWENQWSSLQGAPGDGWIHLARRLAPTGHKLMPDELINKRTIPTYNTFTFFKEKLLKQEKTYMQQHEL